MKPDSIGFRLWEYVKLIRAYQWYKNLVIFLPLFFIGGLFDFRLLLEVFMGFLALSFISSSSYVLNDLFDLKKDCMHPEKKQRPLASGTVSAFEATLIAALFLILSLGIAYSLSFLFLLSTLALFIFTLLYSLGLKREPVLDIILIAMNFVIRAASGAFIIQSFISPWLIMCPFFLALFLAVNKRESDARLLKANYASHSSHGKSSSDYQKALPVNYSPEMLKALLVVSTTCLIIVYSLYAFSKSSLLLVTIPVAIYVVFRLYGLGLEGSEIARQTHLVYRDWRLLLGIIVWIVLLFFVLYVSEPVGLINYLSNSLT
ncbi:UbiA prenyltransferase family protein [Candidatus Woesearchaeota archaeon]|nr:UbiA prenyltransferase family protein [Candidatus Woesearchaeota archaeon]